MSRRWWSDADVARDLLGRVSSDDGVSGAGAALLGLHAVGAQALSGLASSTAVSVDEVKSALAGVDHSSAADAWQVTAGGDLDEVKAAADAGALEIVDTLTSAGVPWPLALQRAAEGYGLPPGDAAVYATQVAAPVLPPPVVADVADVALGAWASNASARTAEPVAKADEDWVEVRVGGRKIRRRVLRDDDGQFAEQGDQGAVQEQAKVREFDGSALSRSAFKALSAEERKAYLAARLKVAQGRRRRRGREAERKKKIVEQKQVAMRAQAQRELERFKQGKPTAKKATVKVNEARIASGKKQERERVKERAKRAAVKRATRARQRRADRMAARAKLGAADFDAVTELESTKMVDALATRWPIGHPSDPGVPEHAAAIGVMAGNLMQEASSQLMIAEADRGLGPDETGMHRIRKFTFNPNADKVPVLRTNIYGVMMLQRAKELESIPMVSMYAANSAWQNRRREEFNGGFEEEMRDSSPGSMSPKLFQFVMAPADGSIARSSQSGVLEFDIPLSEITAISDPHRTAASGVLEPLLSTSLEFSAGMHEYLNAAQQFYRDLGDIAMPSIHGGENAASTAQDAMFDKMSLYEMRELNDIMYGSGEEGVGGLWSLLGSIHADVYHPQDSGDKRVGAMSYPKDSNDAYNTEHNLQEAMGIYDTQEVRQVVTEAKHRILSDAMMQATGYDSEKAARLGKYLMQSGIMVSLDEPDLGLDSDGFTIPAAVAKAYEDFQGAIGSNDLLNGAYRDQRGKVVVGSGLSDEDFEDLDVKLIDRFGEDNSGVEIRSEIMMAIKGPDRKG